VLERLRVTGAARAVWPVLELDGRIVWMRGVDVDPEQGITVTAQPLGQSQADSSHPA
jgi:tRNA(Ile)-lysidine synthase